MEHRVAPYSGRGKKAQHTAEESILGLVNGPWRTEGMALCGSYIAAVWHCH